MPSRLRARARLSWRTPVCALFRCAFVNPFVSSPCGRGVARRAAQSPALQSPATGQGETQAAALGPGRRQCWAGGGARHSWALEASCADGLRSAITRVRLPRLRLAGRVSGEHAYRGLWNADLRALADFMFTGCRCPHWEAPWSTPAARAHQLISAAACQMARLLLAHAACVEMFLLLAYMTSQWPGGKFAGHKLASSNLAGHAAYPAAPAHLQCTNFKVALSNLEGSRRRPRAACTTRRGLLRGSWPGGTASHPTRRGAAALKSLRSPHKQALKRLERLGT